jgi:Outer membrane protein and related peptidoglycan-associated (lipo)proteins
MLKRFAVGVSLMAMTVAAAAQVAPPPVRCDCCAKKPVIEDKTYASFTGQVAVVTQTEDPNDTNQWKNRVVMIWDLTNQAGAPLDVQWTAPSTTPYSHPSWTVTNLGEVFGLTLNDSGDIFVAATRIYGNNNVGSLGIGTPAQRAGNIYRLQQPSGAAVFYSQLPQGPSGEGLGNVTYDCGHKSLYASDFADGLIYRIDGPGPAGIKPNPWDHGANLPSAISPTGALLNRSPIVGNDGASSYAALGRRAWAVRVYKNRLYYSIWGADFSRAAGSNEVWSVALDPNGDPVPPARLEITVPPYTGHPVSNPVADISFGPMGTMMLAERHMIGNNTSWAHAARLLEYSWNGAQWVLPNPTAYRVGIFINSFSGTNSAGGVDFDFSPGGHVWGSGDALHYCVVCGPADLNYCSNCIDRVYGIQGFPSGGGNITNSILIDINDYTVNHNKFEIGDVRIPCPDCLNPVVAPVINGPQTTCVLPAQYSVTPQSGVTYSWTVTGETPASGSGPSINVTWTAAGGTISVTATAAGGGCGGVTTTLPVSPCNTGCDYCNQFKTDVAINAATALGGGLESITPVVSTGMPGVTNVTVTLLSASVAYSPTSCGTSGPLPAYISSASASSIAALNPPLLPVPNGSQAIWHSSTAVNLSGGATTPFQIKLPPPPVFTNLHCHASFSFCLRVYFSDSQCRNCDVIRCFGPFPYGTNLIEPGGGVTGFTPYPLPFVVGGTTITAPPDSFLASVLPFVQNSNNLTAPQRFVMTGLTFEPGKAVMTESSTPILQSLALLLNAFPSLAIRLEGFTDNSGDAAANQRMSLERAQALKSFLQRAGIDASRIATEGFGAANPTAPNDSEEGRARNRRIEIVIMRK